MPTVSSSNIKTTFNKSGACTCPYCGKDFYLIEEDGHPVRRSKCNRCGFSWINRSESPQKCPKCGSYAWNKPALRCACMVCRYTWTSRKLEGPSRCPNCKSNRWSEVPKKVDKIITEENTENVIQSWVLKRYSKDIGCIDIACELGLPLFKVMKIVQEEYKLKITPLLCTERKQ